VRSPECLSQFKFKIRLSEHICGNLRVRGDREGRWGVLRAVVDRGVVEGGV